MYSLETINEFAEEDKTFIEQVLTVFVNDTQQSIKEMHQALKEKDWNALRQVSHKYKSHILMLKIESATSIIKQIEEYAEKEINLAELPKLISELENRCNLVVKSILEDFNLST